MKTVTILGSKPGACLPEGGVAYCANGAIGFYGDALGRFESVINVVSALVLRKSRFSAQQEHAALYAAKGSAICAARPDRLILVESADHPRLGDELEAWLRESGYISPICRLTPEDRISLQVRLSGLRHPVVTRASLAQPLQMVLRDVMHLVRHRLGLLHGEVKGKFRPSTGVIALLHAISEHGPQAEYVLAGIGLSQRHLHQVGGKIVAGKVSAGRAALEPHVAADTVILRALARRFMLRADDPELAGALSGGAHGSAEKERS